ncbi:DUF397 domain-containing protein [Streptomyces bobili]|uniref:DUF397 domain-containing protein n=1 Tax=Streptomyces bobili TaxID=67280 RepID=UPI0033B2C03B
MFRSSAPGFEPVWFKSSYSGGNYTECVVTAFVPGGVLVRTDPVQRAALDPDRPRCHQRGCLLHQRG